MKTILTILLLATTVSAGPYYVRYFQDTGEKTAYDVDFPIESYTMGTNGTYFTGMPEFTRRQGVFSTTNNPAGKTNISQFKDAIILNPLTLKRQFEAEKEITPAVQALVDAINKRFPTNKITDAELTTATTNRIKAISATAVEAIEK